MPRIYSMTAPSFLKGFRTVFLSYHKYTRMADMIMVTAFIFSENLVLYKWWGTRCVNGFLAHLWHTVSSLKFRLRYFWSLCLFTNGRAFIIGVMATVLLQYLCDTFLPYSPMADMSIVYYGISCIVNPHKVFLSRSYSNLCYSKLKVKFLQYIPKVLSYSPTVLRPIWS